MIKSCKKPPVYFESTTGSFYSQYAGLPLKSHVVDVDYTGSAISNCFVVNMADDTNISCFQGLLKGTYGFVDLGSLQYFLTPSGLFQTNSLVGIIKNASSSSIPANVLAQGYTTIDSQSITGPQGSTPSPNMVMAENISSVLYFNNTSYTDATDFKTAMSGVYLIYELATPTTPTITEAQFNTLLSAFNISGEAFKIPFDTPIYGGSYDCLTGIVTSNKDSGGGDISPTYQQTATANCLTLLGENNIWADTGNTTLEYLKAGR